MTTQLRDSCIVFNTASFQKDLENLLDPFAKKFTRINRNYLLFHLFFLAILSIEFIYFALLFSSFLKTITMAFWLAGIFLTVFTYLLLLFYIKGRHPEKLLHLRNQYIHAAQTCIPFNIDTLEYHCCITEAIVHLMDKLKISPPQTAWKNSCKTLFYFIEKFKIWALWKDLLKFKEMLLFIAIQEHIKLIKKEPSDLEAHASLASNYLALAELYQDFKHIILNDDACWIPPEYTSEKILQKLHVALHHALQEYHIMDEYAPNDPWIHVQKATLYKGLGQAELEKKEYEIILALDPQNDEILFRLGKLYFRQGEGAKGLKIYQLLQSLHAEKACELLCYYDAYFIEETTFN